jgi:DNA topoisomerase I
MIIIVESPSKCKLIESYSGIQCIASCGHIRILETIQDNLPQYSIIKKNIQYLKKSLKNIPKKDIILATDNDREGEAIAWHICDYFKLDITKTKRIIFNEITKHAIQYALSNPTIINMNLVNSQKTRQMLDYKIGYTISPYVWNFTSNKTTSAGRCQTPALRILYENELKELEISNQYKTIGYFTKHNIPFVIHLKDPSLFLNESIDYQDYELSYVKKKITKPPPLSLTTARLQKLASIELNYSPKKTMEIAQHLYESGHITYMRTDSHSYSNEFIKSLSNPIIRPYLLNNTHAHEAIHPTDIHVLNVNKEYQDLYSLIHTITLQSVMEDAIYDVLECKIKAPVDLYYEYNCESIYKQGWKSNEPINPWYLYLLSIQSINQPNKIKSVQEINYHSHLSESNLIETLEHYGIGRPSTYSSIIETLKERGYAKLVNIKGKEYDVIEYELQNKKINKKIIKKIIGDEKNKLKIQELGKTVIQYLITDYDHLFNYKYTSLLEDYLDKIALGEMDGTDILSKLSLPEPTLYKPTDILLKNYGPYEGVDVLLYKNEYGYYVLYGKKKLQLRYLASRKVEEITLDYILKKLKDNTLIRSITEDIHIRNGKYGVYIQTPTKNINLKLFKEDYLTCDESEIMKFINLNKLSNSLDKIR